MEDSKDGEGCGTNNQTLVISIDGDVVFTFENQHKIQVSSVVLAHASPVFKAMFGDKFKEGSHPRSTKEPLEILLQDDDSDAMRWLCNLLHFRDHSSGELSGRPISQCASQILRLAVVTDKYDCVQPLGPASEALLGRYATYFTDEAMPLECVVNLIAAAYLFRQGTLFTVLTRRMILDYTEPFSSAFECDGVAVVPSMTFCKAMTGGMELSF